LEPNFLITALLSFAAFCFILAFVKAYNGLIKKSNQVKNAFSTIDVMLKKRYDLIPNLIELVKQYSSHEETVLTNIASLRATGMSATLSKEKLKVNSQLKSAVRGIMINMEAYPELKANDIAFPMSEQFFELQIRKSLLDPKTFDRDLSIVRFMCSIIKELGLNTRIWGKD
jgi:hypothetical protein